MITISNSVTIPEIVAAAQKANDLLRDRSFFDAIRMHTSFDLADTSPAKVAELMETATIVMTVEMYHSGNRRVFGYDDPAHPEIIHINRNRNEFNIPALTNTIIHETVHAVNNYNQQLEFGHGDNSSRGKGNTAPYWIGNLAEGMAGGNLLITHLPIHEGSPEAFLAEEDLVAAFLGDDTLKAANQSFKQIKKNYSVTLKGSDGGQLNFVQVKLEDVDIGLESTDSVIWTSEDTEIRFTPPMSIFLKVQAVQGTTWDISVQEKGGSEPCYKAKGRTGDQPGANQPNLSIRNTETNCL